MKGGSFGREKRHEFKNKDWSIDGRRKWLFVLIAVLPQDGVEILVHGLETRSHLDNWSLLQEHSPRQQKYYA